MPSFFGSGLGRARGQRWSSQSTCDGSASRIEAVLHAEFRVLHEEIAELRELLNAKPAAPQRARPPATPKRGLGRGLDALMAQGKQPGWSESLIPGQENDDGPDGEMPARPA